MKSCVALRSFFLVDADSSLDLKILVNSQACLQYNTIVFRTEIILDLYWYLISLDYNYDTKKYFIQRSELIICVVRISNRGTSYLVPVQV